MLSLNLHVVAACSFIFIFLFYFIFGLCDSNDSDENCEMLPSQRNSSSNNSTMAARDIRDEIADYCITHGQVSWQWEKVFG